MGRYVLLGDCESPHLIKWARALSSRVELYVASSRGIAPEIAALLPPLRCLALDTQPRVEGGNLAVLAALPRLARWLAGIEPTWLHAHYLTSHGTLAWLAKRLWRLRCGLVSSGWGSDVLVAPDRSRALRWLTTRVLKASTLCTSDSAHMAERMRSLGAREVMTFPFGLDALPDDTGPKQERLFFTNRALEPSYAPHNVLEVFADIAPAWPDAMLVIANDGSLRAELERAAAASGWGSRIRFVGRLDAAAQAAWYRSARWYLSMPPSDSIAVSVLEAMAHGCVPLLSDLPANRELVHDGDNGLIVGATATGTVAAMEGLLPRLDAIVQANRHWIAQHALFPQAVERFLARLSELERAP
jgi:glycosyltransferase involved in cell wall biosynthesis